MPTISVFTPSHDPSYLNDAWESLDSQTFPDFEWIVVLNGGAQWNPPKDPRVRVVKRNKLTGKVGALKAEACKLAKGNYLVELDHDDLLARSCLDVINDAFTCNRDVGLVYSDTAQINSDGTRNESKFAEGHGWNYYDDEVSVGSRPTSHGLRRQAADTAQCLLYLVCAQPRQSIPALDLRGSRWLQRRPRHCR